QAVYGHRSGALKSDFYDNPGGGTSNVFSERNKAEHTRMRKRIANIFSQQNVLNFEPRVREHIIRLWIHFAEASLFIIASSLLATFTFSEKKDATGKAIEPQIEGVSNAIVLELKPFDFELHLRSADHRRLILE
ncbi:unnamed protein product, partial [Rhizoctonia solani]